MYGTLGTPEDVDVHTGMGVYRGAKCFQGQRMMWTDYLESRACDWDTLSGRPDCTNTWGACIVPLPQACDDRLVACG